MSERDKFAPVIEGFDCSGITDPYSYRCEPFYVDGENAGTLLDGSTVHDVLASKIRLSWNLTVLTPERYAALIAALEGADTLDTVNALVYDATCDAVRLATFHVTRPACRAVNNFGATHIIPQSALVLEEASPIARFRVTPPDKLSYDIGEALDLSGLTVTAYDKDGAASDITAQCAVTPADGTPFLKSGAVTLTVAYDSAPLVQFPVSVADDEIIASGEYWTLFRKGLLSIYCYGRMPDGIPWYNYNASITNVIISNRVTSIGNYACLDCIYLTSVTIPDGVTSIGSFAFSGCFALTSVTIPDSVTSIGAGAFAQCWALPSVTIPDSVTSIGRQAFYECKRFTSVTIPDGVTSISDSAFYECNRLTSVTIPDSVTSIGSQAFFGCSSLPSVTIPDSVTSIGDGAFGRCSTLNNVTIPNGVTSIKAGAFQYCSSLTNITIPDSVTSIRKFAFYECRNLTSVTINRNATVANNAFPSGCVINYYED